MQWEQNFKRVYINWDKAYTPSGVFGSKSEKAGKKVKIYGVATIININLQKSTPGVICRYFQCNCESEELALLK